MCIEKLGYNINANIPRLVEFHMTKFYAYVRKHYCNIVVVIIATRIISDDKSILALL